MPEVSVIIPVYNTAPYLRQCLDSVRAQTFTDYELILVDDGSMDNSGAICDEYAKRDGRIRVIHKENGGVSSARNAGLDAAKGELIYFCDSDDYIENDLLMDAVHAMDGYDTVVFNRDIVDRDGCRIVLPTNYQVKVNNWKGLEEKSRFLAVDYFAWKIGWSSWCRIMRREIIEKYRIRFPEGAIIAEDMCFVFCYLLHSNSICSIPGVYYHHVRHDGSTLAVQEKRFNFNNNNEVSKYIFRHLNQYTDQVLLEEYYPFVFLGVMRDALSYVRRGAQAISIRKTRPILMREIRDTSFFIEQTRAVVNSKRLLFREKGIVSAMMILTEWIYYRDGNDVQLTVMRLCVFVLRAIRKVLKKLHVTSSVRRVNNRNH